jgi:hypothetical protein
VSIRELGDGGEAPPLRRFHTGLDLPAGLEWLEAAISQSHAANSSRYHGGAGDVLRWLTERGCYTRIPVRGVPPLADKFMAANERRLNSALSSICLDGVPIGASVELWGEMDDQDGEFRCERELPFVALTEEKERFLLKPHRAPVEVGVTRAATTLGHLEHCRRLVRWPYGHCELIVFALRPDRSTRKDDALAAVHGT